MCVCVRARTRYQAIAVCEGVGRGAERVTERVRTNTHAYTFLHLQWKVCTGRTLRSKNKFANAVVDNAVVKRRPV